MIGGGFNGQWVRTRTREQAQLFAKEFAQSGSTSGKRLPGRAFVVAIAVLLVVAAVAALL